MMPETRDHVSVRMDNILVELPLTPSKPSIFRVNHDFRCVNEKLYDPKVVAIGPYHHGKDHLHKFSYLKLLLKRRNESSVDKYVIAMRSLIDKARKCYEETFELSPDDFLQMLLLDGFFTIELIRKYCFDELIERDDPIFQYEQVLSQLRHDLMLVENQIPFFVLNQLFSMTKSGNPDDDLYYLIQLFIDDISPWPEASSQITTKVSSKSIDHLLGLVYKFWCSSFANMIETKPKEEEKFVGINSTTELQEAGVKFEKGTHQTHCLDIKFSNGVIKIPSLDVSDETESIFRNLIAYEHNFIDNHPKYVTDYAFFLHCLINSSKDVEILRRRGIINNLLGDDEMVYNMFNRLGKNIPTSFSLCYGNIFDQVNKHCGYRGNRWIANLRHNYFNSPWAFIAFFASAMVLLFTLTQTVFSILSYVKS